MTAYQEARKIYFMMEEGQSIVFDIQYGKKVRDRLNHIKKRFPNNNAPIKTKKENGKIIFTRQIITGNVHMDSQ